MKRVLSIGAAALACATSLLAAGPASGASQVAVSGATGLRDVMLVGNNWQGTASIVDADTRAMLKSGINLIPDKAQELQKQKAAEPSP